MGTLIDTDIDGNRLYLSPTSGEVFLKLVAFERSKKIGTITGDVLTLRRPKEEHKYRKTEAYASNYALLAHVPGYRYVKLLTKDKGWLLKRSEFLAHSHVMNYKQSGYEAQCVITIEILDKISS